MSARLKRNAHILNALAHSKPSVRNAILRSRNHDLTHCIGECAFNLLRGNIPLTSSQKAKLTRYKQQLRQVANRRVSLQNKNKIIQKGGFLPALLAPLLSTVIAPLAKTVIGGIVKAIKNKKKK